MKKISLVKDKIDGSPFAVLLINKNTVTAYGVPGQGSTWAQWINSQNTTLSEIDELLDVRLAINAPVLANSINESYVSTFLDQPTTDMLMNELNKKSFLQVVETKSEPEPEFIEEIESDLPDFIPVTEWPLSDVSLSAIDVAYKSLLTEYKAKAFQADMQRRSLELEVKWARALWDNDRQGWRCPPNTVNGGQFTNRMGLGCSTGMVRRLGQTLMSIEDRNKLQMTLPGLEDPRGFLYRAGELIDQRAETRIRKFAEGKERRAARKVRNAIAKEGEKAKEQAEKEQRNLKKTSKRFARSGEKLRDIYNVYTPEASVPARLRAAATVKLRQAAADAEQNAIQNLNRSQRRRYRAMSNVTEGKLSPRKITKLRDFGGRIPGSKVGGYVVASPADKEQVDDVFDHDGKPHVWKVFTDMDEMHANPWFGKEFLKDNSQVDIPNPHQNHKWVTVEEILAMAGVNNATKPSHDWIEMRRGRGFKQQNGQNGDMLIRYADTDELKTLAKKNGYYAPRSNLKDNGMSSAAERGQGRKKTKPSQSGPIGDMLFEPDELPPAVRKRVSAAWTGSRQKIGEWIRNLDPLLEDDKKTRRQNRRSQRTKTKTSSSATAANILTAMLGAEPNKTGAKKLYTEENAIYFPQNPMNEQGFNFDFLDNVWTNEPTAPAARYGWNEVVGQPTREFEVLKNLIDRIIAEHDAGVMTQSVDSANDLETLIQLLRGKSFEDEGVRTAGLASLHNARVVELFDGEENKKVIMLDTMNFLPWLGEEEDGAEDGTSGLIALTSYSTQINAPDDVVELAEQGKIRLQELVQMAREANAAENSGTISQGQAFGYSLPNRGGWSVVRWNSTRGITFNKAGAPLSIAAQEYYGSPSWDEGQFSTYIPGARNSRVDLRSGGLISGQMGNETIITPEGESVWENSSIDPWTGLPLDPQKQAIFSNGKRVTSGGRRKKGRRSTTGPTPQSPGIVDRFLSGEGRELSRERREARRTLKGKLPRDTRPIRQRIQAAAIERGRRVTGEARPEWIQAPELDRSVLERESLAATGELPSTQRINRTELPHIYDFPTPEDFPTGAMWGNSGDNRQRLDNLNDSLVDMGNSFYPPVTQEDIDKAAKLAEILYQWLDDVNDPSQPELPGETSNWGHTSWNKQGDFTYVTDNRDETMPPIAIIHNGSGTTHFIDKNGKHLVSLAARKASNGEDVWVPVGSRETHVRLRGDNTPQAGFIQTLLGKFRRRDAQEKEKTKPGIAGIRQRRRHVTLQNSPSGGVYGIEEYIKTAKLLPSNGIQNANTIGPYAFAAQQRVGASISDYNSYDSGLILEAATNMADRLAVDLKRRLGLAPQDELTIPAIKDKIEDLRKQGRNRESGMMINDMHDLAVLDDIIESGDTRVVDNLKPGRRHELIDVILVTKLDDTVKKKRRPFDISEIVIPANAALSQAGRRRPRVRTFTSGAPLLDEPSPDASTVAPQRQATGPALIPGVGDVTGTIVFQNGKYFDTTTGRYLEDLSGLDSSSPDVIYQPISMDEALTNGVDFLPEEWPIIQVSAGPGVPGRNLAAIAPGVDNPKLPPLGVRRNAINKITSIPESFTEAFYLLRNRWRALAAEDKNQTGRAWGRSVYSTSEMLDGQGSPLLSMADGLESEEGISTYFAPVNAGVTVGGDQIRALVASLRTQSRKTSNPLFAPYLDNSVLSLEEITAAGNTTARSGFMTGTRNWLEMVDALGLRTVLPFDTIYLPSGGNDRTHNTVPGQWDIFNARDPKVMAVRHLNEAMQLDYSAKRMSDAINSGQQSNWDSMYGKTAGGLYDATPARLAELELERDLAWQRATTSLVAAINDAQEERNQSLRDYREGGSDALVDDSPVDLYKITEFVNHGVVAEQLQSLLTKHVLTNPRIMDTLGNSSIRKMEQEARQANARMERLEMLRAQSAALGLRNKATYTPDDIDPITLLPLLDPHGDGQTQNAPDRPLVDILQTLDEHAAGGFSVEPLIDPVTGVSAPNTIADEQIEALALMDYAYKLAANQADPNDWGYQGLPEADTKFGHLDLDSLPAEQTEAYNDQYPEFWALLEAAGFNGHPLLLSSGEFRELATIEDANGNRQAIPIARGTKSTTSGRSANMLARLRRALLGNGGVMHGPGEYWSGKPTSWNSLNSDETTIGLLLRGRHRIGSSEILVATNDNIRHRPQERNGILSKHTYDALFTIANILDAKGFQRVNWDHGREYVDDFPGLSKKNGNPYVKFDDRTGLYDAADLDLLQQHIDTLMTPGDVSLGEAGLDQAGKMTVEYYSSQNNFFIDSIVPDFKGVTNARAASAVEERQRLNAFLGQNLSWIVQMAQMRRDESDPTNGPSNKQWNRRLDSAIHELVMMHPNTRVAMAGYDALIRHDQNDVDRRITTGSPYSRFGEFDMWESDSSIVEIRPSIVMIMNRSKTPMIRQPILNSGLGGRFQSRPLANSPTVWYKQIGLELSDIVQLGFLLNPPANPTPEEQDKLERIEKILEDWGVTI
jgi:hypothetical protein